MGDNGEVDAAFDLDEGALEQSERPCDIRLGKGADISQGVCRVETDRICDQNKQLIVFQRVAYFRQQLDFS